MLDDPKARTLLQDGFGGKLGDTKLKFSVKNITAKALRPTQAEIDISKSLKHGLTKVECVNKDFEKKVIINNMPLITFRGNYIVDGHHRWAETVILAPESKMVCFNYDGDISPIEMLKAMQGAIAAVMADDNDNNEKIPSGTTQDKNIFEMSRKDLQNYIDETLVTDVLEILQKQYDVESKEKVVEQIIENIEKMKANNYPEIGSPNRGEMPQTDKAGRKRDDKKSSFPDESGSALNKLKKGKIDKNAIR
jgi:hypothetical protein